MRPQQLTLYCRRCKGFIHANICPCEMCNKDEPEFETCYNCEVCAAMILVNRDTGLQVDAIPGQQKVAIKDNYVVPPQPKRVMLESGFGEEYEEEEEED